MSGALRVTITGPDHHGLTADDGPVTEANEFLAALRLRGLSPRTVRAYCCRAHWLMVEHAH
jgi:hypothetical protein